MPATEINFDGLVGPTHNYAGLSLGNVASVTHRGAVSNPRAAALEGLAKMRFLADLGIPQAVLPPHPRPAMEVLRAFGFQGRDAAVLRTAGREAPELLRACCSSSGMWVANAATVTPASDAADGRVHFTPANLVSKLHRSIEPPQTARTLRAIFRDPQRFVVHEPVPGGQGVGDEGAANHTRLAAGHGGAGLHVFVYGHRALDTPRRGAAPRRFPSRQALEASQAVARAHGLPAGRAVFVRQHPGAIDAGVFHNDVIAVGHEHFLFCHEQAWVDGRRVQAELRRRFRALPGGAALQIETVRGGDVPLADAVRSYLFNSQLVTPGPERMALIAPVECRETPSVRRYLEQLVSAGRTPIRQVHYVDLRQSMRNGGGPACLRLRVVLTSAELAALPSGVRLTPESHAALRAWVQRHYRDELRAADLADPHLLEESRRALDELTRLLGLGSIYPFQRAGNPG
jgi:succinylarginine dihydrolase